MQHQNIRMLTCLFLLSAIGFNACKKDIKTELPENIKSVGLNFYPASDFLITSTSALYTYTGIYVDNYIANPVFGGSIPPSPYFVRNPVNGSISEFPRIHGGTVTYVNYNAGSHHLMFADSTNTVVKDTTINPADQSYTCVYLADAPAPANTVAAYITVAVQEDRSVMPANKVGVRFIHLGPDAGNLTVSQIQTDGTQKALLSDAVHFSQVTPYQYLDSTANVNGELKFLLANAASNITLLTGVPFNPGKRYVVVISGFINDQQRQINNQSSTGTIQKKSVMVTHNLRAAVRRIY